MEIKLIDFQQHGDERGMLVALEENKEIPFDIKRVYYIYATKENVRRGYHAHKKLQQILICINGSCTIHLDDGESTAEVELNKPFEGVFIEQAVWREMYNFSSDAILLVLASEIYDESDYIRDYQEYIAYKRNMR